MNNPMNNQRELSLFAKVLDVAQQKGISLVGFRFINTETMQLTDIPSDLFGSMMEQGDLSVESWRLLMGDENCKYVKERVMVKNDNSSLFSTEN